MPEVFVEKVGEFADGDRRIVFHNGIEIGVFHWQAATTPTKTSACTRAALKLGAEKLARVA